MNEKILIAILIIIGILLIFGGIGNNMTQQVHILDGEIVKTNYKEVYDDGKIEESSTFDLYYTIEKEAVVGSSLLIKCYDENGNLTEEKEIDSTSDGEWHLRLSEPAYSATITIKYDFGLSSEPFKISKFKEENKTYHSEKIDYSKVSDGHRRYDVLAMSQNPDVVYTGMEGDYYVYEYPSNLPYASNRVKINKYTGKVE